MDVTDGQKKEIIIPTDDESVEQALLELDCKLDAWAAVILQTQADLKEYINSVKSDIGSHLSNVADESEHDIQNAKTVDTNTFDLDKLLNIKPAGNSLPAIPKIEKAIIEKEEVKRDISTEASKDDSVKEKVQREEALLASLEPEMAKKVQVLRRLSNNKKSVEELIAQIKASTEAKPADDGKTKKRSFWRFG
jgi:hypothetical protein